MRKAYPSDLTDAQWAILEPLIPVATTGRPRTIDTREVLNAIFYQARSGCQWDTVIPQVSYAATAFRTIKLAVRFRG
jgi:transposase